MASWGGEQGSFLRGACVCPLSSSSLQVPVLPFVSWLLYSVRDSLQELELRETLTYLEYLLQACLPGLLLAVPGLATLHPVPSVTGSQELGLVPFTLCLLWGQRSQFLSVAGGLGHGVSFK